MDTLECLAEEVRKLTITVGSLTETVSHHINNFDTHTADEHELVKRLITAQEENAKAITAISLSVDAQTEATKGLIEIYPTPRSLAKFAKWSSSLLATLAALYAYAKLK